MVRCEEGGGDEEEAAKNTTMSVVDEEEAVKDTMFEIGVLASGLQQVLEEPNDADVAQTFPGHDSLCLRIEKTLYYGRLPATERPSLPFTQVAVEEFAGIGLERLARLDISRASDMAKDACAGPSCLVLALIYLDRLKKQNPDYLKSVSSADLFLVSMMVASKFLHDDGEEDEVFNDEWAKAANIDIKEFNKLEIEFLSAIDWKINVPTSDFDSTLLKIEKKIAFKQLSDRGWSSYTDLFVLSQGTHYEKLWKLFTETSLKVTGVCMAAYAASILALIGTATILNQTPFGPTAVSQSLKSLRGGGGGRDCSRNTDTVPEPERNLTTAAELLTASLLVTTLQAAPVNGEDADFSPDVNARLEMNPFSRLGNEQPNETDSSGGGGGGRGEEVDPAGYIMEHNAFIRHATTTYLGDYKIQRPSVPPDDDETYFGISGSRRQRKQPDKYQDLSSQPEGLFINTDTFLDLRGEYLNTLDGMEWPALESHVGKQSSCPFLQWGHRSYLPYQLSILV